MANNNENDKPVIRKTWLMIKKAPVVVKNLFMTKDNKRFITADGHEFLVKENKEEPEPAPQYIMHEAAAIWLGENGLNENNEWVDTVNGHTFSPLASAVPQHNSEAKLLDFNAFGGMKCSFPLPATTETQYTIELVVRDMDEALPSYPTDKWSKLIGPEMASWQNKNKSFDLHAFWSDKAYCISYRTASSTDANYYSTRVREHGLTTFTIIPTQGLWINGEKEASCNLDCIETQFALGSGIGGYSSYSQTKFKVHGFRYYPIELTDEQIKNNYEVDKITYGE